MRTTILRALIFAVALAAVSLAVDLLLMAFVESGPAHGRTRQFAMFRIALHGATFVLSAAGAALGFAFLRGHSIAPRAVVSMGVVLGLATSAVVHAGLKVGGYLGIAAWLIVGSGLVAYLGGRVLGSRHDGASK